MLHVDSPCFLVLDDDDLVHKVIARVVERRRLGVQLVRVDLAADADALLASGSAFAGMVLDVYLPDGSGFDVLGKARHLPERASTPALVMTGAPDVEMINRAYDLDADVITKPVEEFERLVRFFNRVAPATKASRTPPDDTHIPATLDGCIRRLRELHERYPDGRTRYLIGAVVAALKLRPDLYGANAVCVAASATGEDIPSLYRYATVADRWPIAAFDALLARRGSGGFGLSWSHLVFLATVVSDAAREHLTNKALEERLCVRQLQAAANDLRRR